MTNDDDAATVERRGIHMPCNATCGGTKHKISCRSGYRTEEEAKARRDKPIGATPLAFELKHMGSTGPRIVTHLQY